jgi:hypothetical protein
MQQTQLEGYSWLRISCWFKTGPFEGVALNRLWEATALNGPALGHLEALNQASLEEAISGLISLR